MAVLAATCEIDATSLKQSEERLELDAEKQRTIQLWLDAERHRQRAVKAKMELASVEAKIEAEKQSCAQLTSELRELVTLLLSRN